VHVPRQESDRSYIGVLGVLLLPLSVILIFEFGVVPAVCYYLFILLFQLVSFCLFTDETYLGKNYHMVIGFLSILLMAYFLMCLLQRYQLLSKIVKIFTPLCHTKADPPNIQNDLHTRQRLMGEGENNFNGK
jgi:hypothetical protein